MSESIEDQARRRRSVRSLIVILILGLVGALILAFRAKLRGPTDAEDVLAHLQEVRQDVALVAFTAGRDGKPEPADSMIAINSDQKMPLAGVSRLPILLAYAEEVAQGRLRAEEAVLVSAWERHYLPGTDGGAHGKALRKLGVKVDAGGFAAEPNAEAKLDDIVSALIVHGDHAAGDYLLGRLGEARVNEAARRAGLETHDPILPMTGLFLVAASVKDEAGAKALLDRGPEALAEAVREAAAQFDAELAGTPAQRNWLERFPTPGAGVQSLWSDRAMTQGTAGQYAGLLARLATGNWGGTEARALVVRHLGWPLALEGNAELFTAFGGKGGTLVSIMTEATYVVPKQGDFESKPRVVVLFQRRMPMLRWFALVRSLTHQQFMLKLALDRAFAETTQQALRAP